MGDVQYAASVVSGYMEKIIKLFQPGVKIAVIVRSPDHPDRDFMLTDDSIEELQALLTRRGESPVNKEATPL